MNKIVSTTIDELDQLDQKYSRENKRQSWNLRSRIGDHEKIIFCYYELGNVPNFLGFPVSDILFYVLTDIKLIFIDANSVNRLEEIKLKNIKQLRMLVFGFVKLGIEINPPESEGRIFVGVKDKNFLQSRIDDILKAKSNLEVRLLSSRENKNSSNSLSQNSIAEQLEKLANLYKSGALSDDEYKKAKGKILSNN
jgi:hypothetical protein